MQRFIVPMEKSTRVERGPARERHGGRQPAHLKKKSFISHITKPVSNYRVYVSFFGRKYCVITRDSFFPKKTLIISNKFYLPISVL